MAAKGLLLRPERFTCRFGRVLPVKEGNIATAEVVISRRPWTGEDESAAGREGACSVRELEEIITFATGLTNASSRSTLLQSTT